MNFVANSVFSEIWQVGQGVVGVRFTVGTHLLRFAERMPCFHPKCKEYSMSFKLRLLIEYQVCKY